MVLESSQQQIESIRFEVGVGVQKKDHPAV